jgi:hypothetical protein
MLEMDWEVHMKRTINLSFLAVAVVLYLSASAFAQHGHAMRHSSSSHATSADKTGEQSITQKLTDNTKLADKISKLTEMSATSACQGFKNLGQCVAAAHVAKNLDVPGGFTALKDKMLGISANGSSTTTSKPMSLGKAIQTLDPKADVKAETKKAKQQADQDVKDSGANS